MTSVKITKIQKASKKGTKRTLQANRIPGVFVGLEGFGHGMRWEGMVHYYPRRRRTKQEIEEEARIARMKQEVGEAKSSRTRIFTEDPREAFGRPESITGSHLGVISLGAGSAATEPALGLDSSNADFVPPPTAYTVPTEAFDPSMFQADPSNIFAPMDHPLRLEECMQPNNLGDMDQFFPYYPPASQERQGASFSGSDNRHGGLNNATFPGGYEGQGVLNLGFAECSSNSPYDSDNLLADGISVSTLPASMASEHFEFNADYGDHSIFEQCAQADTPYVQMPIASAIPRAFTEEGFNPSWIEW